MYYENFEKLCNLKNVKPGAVSKATGISTATLTNWKYDRYTPKQDKLQLIADFFGVTVDYLMSGKEDSEKKESPFTARDERDIKKSLDKFMESLETKDGAPLYYDGNELELTDENKAMLRDALNTALHTVKLINKEKYNPHKNGK